MGVPAMQSATASLAPDLSNESTPIESFPHEALIAQRVLKSGGTHESLLLNEMSHRFKNELASVIGVISVASMRSKDMETCRILKEVVDRLHDHASICSALQMPRGSGVSDMSSYLRNLLVAISRAKLERKGVRLVYRELSSIQCSAVQCWTLGMIVSELITNSLRHAFTESDGIIGVDLVEEDNRIECQVCDNGSCTLPIREGNGLKMVQSLAGSIGGVITQRCGPRGTLSIVSVPR
jgi:two-component sensor histidine kinase